MNRYLSGWAAVVAAALFGILSCTSDESQQSVEQQLRDGRIVFSVTQSPTTPISRSAAALAMSEEPLLCSGDGQELWLLPSVSPMKANVTTRGVQLTSESVMTRFGVSCYKTPSTMGALDGRTPDYFYNLEATKANELSDYTISQSYYWPSNDERLWFFAYYPYNSGESNPEDNENVVLSSSTAEGPQTIDFTVAEAAADQVDLMTAHTGQTDGFLTQSSPRVDLTFEHQLTGIRFKVGSQFPTKGYIQSIQLKNVYNHGIYTIGGTWSHVDGDIGNFTVEYANDTKVTDTPGQMITDDDAVFLMIPTTFSYEANTPEESKAKIIVQFWDGDATHEVTASLEGTTWAAGQTVTYSLSSEKLTTLKIDHIDYAATVAGAPYTGWQNTDAVGMYVVANGKNGGTDLRYTNVKCTYVKPNNVAEGTWKIALVADGDDWKPVIMYPGDNYYFYYPYNENGPAGTPSAGNESDASSDKFWSSVITSHNILPDQSTPANFKASDLQVSKAVVPTATNGLAASTISAMMERKVGLAVISLGTDQANKSVTFTNGVAGTPVKDNVTATDQFSGNIPHQNGSKYYFYTLAGEETAINSVSTEKDAWEESLKYTLAAGANQEKTAHSDRKNWDYINAIWNYGYSGEVQVFTTLYNETYTIECWGAQGGDLNGFYGGKGGYCKANFNLAGTYYIHVGLDGNYDLGNLNAITTPLYGGGGVSGEFKKYGMNGGGATDVRTSSASSWQNEDGLKTRFIVAGGGGGANNRQNGYNSGDGGYGGGLTGGTGSSVPSPPATTVTSAYAILTGGTQTSGGTNTNYTSTGSEITTYPGSSGQFGYAMAIPTASTPSGAQHTQSAGGGGWWGGAGGHHCGGGGGSSFISGHTGCVAIAETPLTCVSGTSVMIDGGGHEWTTTSRGDSKAMPAPSGGTETGHSGSGYCRITLTRW